MAREERNFLRGILGPVILKMYNKKAVISSRMVPGTMKQTSATKKTAMEFGLASKLGSMIRTVFKTDIGIYRDAQMHNRLTSELHNSLLACKIGETGFYDFKEDSFQTLSLVEYQLSSTLRKRMIQKPFFNLDNGVLRIKFDPQDARALVQFPGDSTSCQFSMSTALFRLRDGLMLRIAQTKSIMIQKYGKKIAPPEFTFAVPNGCLCIVSTSLRYSRASVFIDNKKWHAGGISYAAYTGGIFSDTTKRNWIKMDDLKL